MSAPRFKVKSFITAVNACSGVAHEHIQLDHDDYHDQATACQPVLIMFPSACLVHCGVVAV